jgi:hypothetical protein
MMRFLLPTALAYVAPTIIGWKRRVAGAGALAILNVLLGWTGLGWIVCMLWAVCAHTHRNQFYQNQAGRFTGQQIAEHEEFMRWKAQKLGTVPTYHNARSRVQMRSAVDQHDAPHWPAAGALDAGQQLHLPCPAAAAVVAHAGDDVADQHVALCGEVPVCHHLGNTRKSPLPPVGCESKARHDRQGFIWRMLPPWTETPAAGDDPANDGEADINDEGQ